MKLVSFSVQGGAPQAGIMSELAADFAGLNIVGLLWGDLSGPDRAGYPTVLDVIASGLTVADLNQKLKRTHPFFRRDQVTSPCAARQPPARLRHRSQLSRSCGRVGNGDPHHACRLLQAPTAIIGPGDAIVLPKNSTQPDYEAELAFVIGKGGYRIPATAWREHVYGYTIVNDVSARDVQCATSQWSMAKSFPTFARWARPS